MTIAEWLNEAPGRQIVITAADRPDRVRFHVRSRCLGRKVACNIDVFEGFLAEMDDPGGYVVQEIKFATESLIHSIKDRN